MCESCFIKGMAVHKGRKLSVTLFGLLTAGSLILDPLIIYTPAVALVVLAIAGFGYAANDYHKIKSEVHAV